MTPTNQRAVEELEAEASRYRASLAPYSSAAYREVTERKIAALDLAITTLRAPGWRPISEEQVEAAAVRMWNSMGAGPEWAHQTERTRNQYRTMARAALATLPPPPGED